MRHLASLEALRNQQHNLAEPIRRLLELMKQMLDGDLRYKLLQEISCLDSIADMDSVRTPSFSTCCWFIPR